MPTPSSETTRLPFWVMLVLSVFAWAPTTHPGYWQSLDGFLPAFNTSHLQRIAAIGIAPDFWRGEGVGAFLLPHLFFRLGFAPVVAVRMAFAIAILAGGVGIYFWLENQLGEKGAALGGLSYMLMPTVLTTVYIHGHLADATMLALLPWLFFAVTPLPQVASRQKQRVFLLFGLLLMVWLWLTQAGLALLATVLVIGYALTVAHSRWILAILIVGAGLGAATLLPVLTESATSTVNFGDHFVYFFQLLRNQWQVVPSIPGWQDDYPFQLGMSVVATSILALWLWFTTQVNEPNDLADRGRWLRFGVAGSLLVIALSLTFSASLWQWSGANGLLTYPWQILVLAAPLLVILPAMLPSLLPDFGKIPLWSALLLLIVASSFSTGTISYTAIDPPLQPLAIFGDNQLAILSAKIDESVPPTVTLTVGWQVLQPVSIDYNIFLQALHEDGTQTLAQFDGQPLPERPATSWSYGEIFTTTFALQMPATQPTAPVYIFGFYDWRDGVRLPVDSDTDDKIVLHGQKD